MHLGVLYCLKKLFLLCFLEFLHFLLSCIEFVYRTCFKDSLFSCILWMTTRTYFHFEFLIFDCRINGELCSTWTWDLDSLCIWVYTCFHNYVFLIARLIRYKNIKNIWNLVPRKRLELLRVKHWFLRPACLPFHHLGIKSCFHL